MTQIGKTIRNTCIFIEQRSGSSPSHGHDRILQQRSIPMRAPPRGACPQARRSGESRARRDWAWPRSGKPGPGGEGCIKIVCCLGNCTRFVSISRRIVSAAIRLGTGKIDPREEDEVGPFDMPGRNGRDGKSAGDCVERECGPHRLKGHVLPLHPCIGPCLSCVPREQVSLSTEEVSPDQHGVKRARDLPKRGFLAAQRAPLPSPRVIQAKLPLLMSKLRKSRPS